MTRISLLFLAVAALSASATAFAGVRLNGLPDNGRGGASRVLVLKGVHADRGRLTR